MPVRYYTAETVNDYYPEVCWDLMQEGMISSPRGIQTRELHPTIVSIADSRKRIVTAYGRVVNLPFALAEVIHILGGINDAQALKYYNTRIIDVAGDTPDARKFNASYGERLRKYHVGANRSTSGPRVDQLRHVISTLASDPDSRQATIVLSHPGDDNYTVETKDRACNIVSHPMIRGGKLDWSQIMRSNDVVWGLPYNFIQWMHVMEYVAAELQVPLGEYTLFQDSLHVYQDKYDECAAISGFDMYEYMEGPLTPMVGHGDEWFFREVVRYEEILRNEGPKPLISGDDNDYWFQVMQALNSFAAFKRGKNEIAFELMPEHSELRWPLMRYYFSIRWNKTAYSQMGRRVLDELCTAFGTEMTPTWLGYE